MLKQSCCAVAAETALYHQPISIPFVDIQQQAAEDDSDSESTSTTSAIATIAAIAAGIAVIAIGRNRGGGVRGGSGSEHV
jgi:hypothetical protein